MRVTEILWSDDRAKHIARHHITPEEVEEAVFDDRGGCTFLVEKARSNKNEKVYAYLGRTYSGRYIKFIYIGKGKGKVYPVTAYDMTAKERRLYHEKR